MTIVYSPAVVDNHVIIVQNPKIKEYTVVSCQNVIINNNEETINIISKNSFFS